MADPDALTVAIEAAAYESWPPREVAAIDGWRLYDSGGFSRRVNSAAPPIWPSGDLVRLGEWFASRDLPFVVRITPQVGLVDAMLADAGFTKEAVTEVMTVDLDEALAADETVIVGERPTEAWLEAQALLQGVAADLDGSWRGIIDRIERPAAFALAGGEADPTAAGFAVCVGSLVGLFEINVAPSHRRRGLGSALSRTLLAWGRDAGARTGYLQVVRANHGAVALYRSLGFEPQYRYWYRRAPAE